MARPSEPPPGRATPRSTGLIRAPGTRPCGAAAAYVVPPGTPGPVHDFVARAEAAGLQRLVLLSGRGADTWGDSSFGLDMRDAEDAVRASSLEWTIVRPNNFDQNFSEELFHAPVVAGELALPAGDVPEPFIDVEDVADVVAAVLTSPGGHGDAPASCRSAIHHVR